MALPSREDIKFMVDNGVMPYTADEWRSIGEGFAAVARFCELMAEQTPERDGEK